MFLHTLLVQECSASSYRPTSGTSKFNGSCSKSSLGEGRQPSQGDPEPCKSFLVWISTDIHEHPCIFLKLNVYPMDVAHKQCPSNRHTQMEAGTAHVLIIQHTRVGKCATWERFFMYRSLILAESEHQVIMQMRFLSGVSFSVRVIL